MELTHQRKTLINNGWFSFDKKLAYRFVAFTIVQMQSNLDFFQNLFIQIVFSIRLYVLQYYDSKLCNTINNFNFHDYNNNDIIRNFTHSITNCF